MKSYLTEKNVTIDSIVLICVDISQLDSIYQSLGITIEMTRTMLLFHFYLFWQGN